MSDNLPAPVRPHHDAAGEPRAPPRPRVEAWQQERDLFMLSETTVTEAWISCENDGLIPVRR